MKPAQPAPQPAAADVDVVVVGCGPVGALTANLLGLRGVSTLVVERSTTPHGQPRAFSCDDEALRIYQQVGLLDQIGADLHQPARADYVNAAGRTFATIDFSQVDFGFGHAPLNFFDQPRLEHVLRGGLDRYDHVELRLGTELVSLYQDDDRVHLVLREVATGQSYPVRARYVLGCDGARSTTRAAVRIPLAGASYAEPWLAVSGDVPAEAIRAPHTTFVCDWRRPAFVSPGARGSYRAEFMLQPDETEADMTRPERIAELVEPYVDPARFTVTRAVIYTFHHLIAQRWREGRVFLLGDAAHQMPPFLGQGLCSGLRDATNLTWKLALVLGRDADPALLDTYEVERRGHTAAMADTSVRLGRVFLARSRPAAWLRDTALRAVQTVPRVRRFVRRFEFKPLPAYDRGLFAGGRRHGAVGTMFPQPRVTVAGSTDPVLLDEVLGAGFALLGTAVPAGGSGWPGVPVRTVVVHPAGTGPAATCAEPDDGQVHVVDVDGVIVAWLRRHRCDAVVLRPDRFVYALGSAADDAMLPSLAAALGTPGTVAATRST
ncbi:bifunctional 3-(3-hydroxy-phenyl)propionate/3-hydroxycinnamic acid hydroxylase [Micromonospora maris]|uniref:Monooxygenase n=1 Tax=Micromonospora maris TaxID=1003110 RepID=A0A9X0LBR7_9ACTN|nr:bifunctional 3-(3-hydroxy-phenyl)propionate/3-hydroxycinnamic acid hydroxylase [Micromonospora maris]AEB44873.1 monooxygenase fad-binding protein [Micromonospora maris AB-18-032]KUJ44334.1 monooxygenase [Micromonospora maris]